MVYLTWLRGALGADSFAAVFLSTVYTLLGFLLLVLSPPVGMVLLTVGIATFGVFVTMARLTRRASPRAHPAPARAPGRTT